MSFAEDGCLSEVEAIHVKQVGAGNLEVGETNGVDTTKLVEELDVEVGEQGDLMEGKNMYVGTDKLEVGLDGGVGKQGDMKEGENKQVESEEEDEHGKQGRGGDLQKTSMTVEEVVTSKEGINSQGGGVSSGATDVGSMGETGGN